MAYEVGILVTPSRTITPDSCSRSGVTPGFEYKVLGHDAESPSRIKILNNRGFVVFVREDLFIPAYINKAKQPEFSF